MRPRLHADPWKNPCPNEGAKPLHTCSAPEGCLGILHQHEGVIGYFDSTTHDCIFLLPRILPLNSLASGRQSFGGFPWQHGVMQWCAQLLLAGGALELLIKYWTAQGPAPLLPQFHLHDKTESISIHYMQRVPSFIITAAAAVENPQFCALLRKICSDWTASREASCSGSPHS